ncbi:MAG: flagellar basal-body MS-ring/collar protein FliF [Eubacteriales bacterium]
MNETLGKFSQQINNFFEKYDKKQKLKMLGVSLMVIAALATLIIVLNRPKMELLADDLTPKQAGEIRDILVESNINHEVSSDSTSIKVESKKIADAKMNLGQNGIPTSGFTYEDAFNSSFSTTESEKQQKIQLAFEQELAASLRTMDGISDAIVKVVMPEQNRTIFDENKEAKASAMLTTSYDLSSQQVQGVVNFLAASVDNLEAENVKVIDTKGKILYLGQGEDINTNIGNQYDYINQRSSQIRRDVMSTLLSMGTYDDAEVVVNLVMDFDKESSVSEDYSTPDGQNSGIPGSSYHYESSGSNNDESGAPGTDSNGANPEYYMPDGSNSESNTIIEQIEYNVNKKITNSEKNPGDIIYDESSVAVVLNQYEVYDEVELEKQGLLDDITFEEFEKENMDVVPIEISDEVVSIVTKATGIDDIQVIGQKVPVFHYKPVSESGSWTQYIIIGLTILIIGLLAFVVYKGMEPVEVSEVTPELSVEDMLATTKEHQDLDEIEFDDKSETRKHIEKFVEDKPDAVAQLLRNWLNEDWE